MSHNALLLNSLPYFNSMHICDFDRVFLVCSLQNCSGGIKLIYALFQCGRKFLETSTLTQTKKTYAAFHRHQIKLDFVSIRSKNSCRFLSCKTMELSIQYCGGHNSATDLRMVISEQ